MKKSIRSRARRKTRTTTRSKWGLCGAAVGTVTSGQVACEPPLREGTSTTIECRLMGLLRTHDQTLDLQLSIHRRGESTWQWRLFWQYDGLTCHVAHAVNCESPMVSDSNPIPRPISFSGNSHYEGGTPSTSSCLDDA